MVYLARIRVRNFLVLSAAILIGCLETTPPSPRLLSAQLHSDGIELLNHSTRVIYTFTADLDTLERMEGWTPCTDPELCEGIQPGQAQLTEFGAIRGYSERTRDLIVLHWFLIPDGAALKADTVRGLRLRLPQR